MPTALPAIEPPAPEAQPSGAPTAAAFFDLDNTVVRGSSVFHLGRGAMATGIIGLHQLARFAWGQFRFIRRGEDTGKLAAIQDRALKMAAGRSRAELLAAVPGIYRDYIDHLIWPQARALIAEHLAAGRDVWLATASPSEIADHIATQLGMTGAVASVLETRDGVLTGNFAGPVLHGDAKSERVAQLAEQRHYNLADCYAYSDSINDVRMLRMVGHPRAVNPDKALQALAEQNGWQVVRFSADSLRAQRRARNRRLAKRREQRRGR